MLLSNCAVFDSKKSKFIKQQEAGGLLSNLTGVKVPILNDLPLLNTLFQKYKMNAIVNKLLLAEDKFISETHLKQPGFTYSACGAFTKTKERIKKLKKQEIQNIFIKTNQRNLAKYLNRRTGAVKVLRDKAFNVDKIPKYDRHQRGLASLAYKFFDKKTSC